MTTKATGTTPKTKKVVKPQAAKELDKTNKVVTTQKVIVHRELKYQYPRSMKDTVARKGFRQKVRNTIRKFERDIAKLKGEDKKILQEKFTAFQTEHLA